MRWPFYLSFVPDCFVLSGRHSSRCRNRVAFNNNGATAASPRAFGQRWGRGGRGSWTEVVNGVVLVTAIQLHLLFFFQPADNTQFGGKQHLWCFNVSATALYWLRRRPMTVQRRFWSWAITVRPLPSCKRNPCPLCSLWVNWIEKIANREVKWSFIE